MLDDVEYHRVIVRAEKHPSLPRHRMDCPLDHAIALAGSNGRVLDHVPPAPVRHLQTPQRRAGSLVTFHDMSLCRHPTSRKKARHPFGDVSTCRLPRNGLAHAHLGRSDLHHEQPWSSAGPLHAINDCDQDVSFPDSSRKQCIANEDAQKDLFYQTGGYSTIDPKRFTSPENAALLLHQLLVRRSLVILQ